MDRRDKKMDVNNGKTKYMYDWYITNKQTPICNLQEATNKTSNDIKIPKRYIKR